MTTQTKQYPLSSNEDVGLYKTFLNKSGINYNNIGILLDEPTYNIILILFSNEIIVDLFRMNLDAEDFSNNTFSFTSSNKVEIRVLQGEYITGEQLISIESIKKIWNRASEQKLNVNQHELKHYILRIWNEVKNAGRGCNFTIETRRIVRETSHGRCMYKGCGIKLTIDEITGIEGNYAYLAHNVASSEQAARGLIALSGKLSNDPNNILYLCDKHHRLIDKIAVSTHPAHLLSRMRKEFIELSETLLDGLKYQPCLTFLILFPVRGNIIEKPTNSQIYSSLSIKNLRQSGKISELISNETSHLDETDDLYWALMIKSIQRISDSLASQCASTDKSVALFAFGAMPTLIALGAMIGNKKGYIPILRDRSSGQWGWVNNKQEKDFFNIKNLDQLTNNEDEIIISFAFTAEPEAFKNASRELNNKRNLKRIEIIAKKLGNDCLSHPDAGDYFSHQLQQLFHKLREENNVHRIHILPCMSNAASVYLGMAIDRYHPDILLYEYADTTGGLKTMIPVLSLSYKEGKTSLTRCKF